MEEVQSVRSNGGATSAFKRKCISIRASFLQGFRYIKAICVGQAKKLTARNEKEATEADLLASKMQVDAADEAEDARKQISKSY